MNGKLAQNKYEHLFDDRSGAMMIHHGKIDEYLGMILDYSKLKTLKIIMIPYVKQIITDLNEHHKTNQVAKAPV